VLLDLANLCIGRANRLGAMVLLGLALATVGCYAIRSETRIVGVYELKAGNAKIMLEIRRDHTFMETITNAGLDHACRHLEVDWGPRYGLTLDTADVCPQVHNSGRCQIRAWKIQIY
jgi:hypothetical protein